MNTLLPVSSLSRCGGVDGRLGQVEGCLFYMWRGGGVTRGMERSRKREIVKEFRGRLGRFMILAGDP